MRGGPVPSPNSAGGHGPQNGPHSIGNLLAVYGSPRKGGNTSLLLDYFLEEVTGYSIERVHLRDLTLSPCAECGRCRETGVCVIQDDMRGYYDKLLTCDRMVIALPVFFLGPPAVAKAFIDRAQSLWIRKYDLGIKAEGVEQRRGVGKAGTVWRLRGVGDARLRARLGCG